VNRCHCKGEEEDGLPSAYPKKWRKAIKPILEEAGSGKGQHTPEEGDGKF